MIGGHTLCSTCMQQMSLRIAICRREVRVCVCAHPCVVCAGGWEGVCVRKRETPHWLMGPKEDQRDAFLTLTGEEPSKVSRHRSPLPIME